MELSELSLLSVSEPPRDPLRSPSSPRPVPARLGRLATRILEQWCSPGYRNKSACASEAVRVLIRHSADVNARDKRWQTPLHVAAARDARRCAALLAPLLCSVNVSDRGGRSALHHAALNGHAQLLLEELDLVVDGQRGGWRQRARRGEQHPGAGRQQGGLLLLLLRSLSGVGGGDRGHFRIHPRRHRTPAPPRADVTLIPGSVGSVTPRLPLPNWSTVLSATAARALSSASMSVSSAAAADSGATVVDIWERRADVGKLVTIQKS
ncbi:hypothetical protein CRUP_033879 [Coryphaenoides rupestris]|nr:hypothetical protein CRUP_033879 [Coryphaenoides rupestris]